MDWDWLRTHGRESGPDGHSLSAVAREHAKPLRHLDDLDPILDRIGDSRFVLLGEATHGTSEFYTWRAELSKRLISERGFSFVAVEGDWPDCYRVNRYVKGLPHSGASAFDVLHAFDRWPTWMWANQEVVDLAEWMREYNENRAPDARVGFYGLDVYSLWQSMHAVVAYLETVDPEFAAQARRAYSCFEPYGEDAQEYARATVLVPMSCEEDAVAMLRALRSTSAEHGDRGRDAYFNAEQNALVVKNAEQYYRTMVRGGAASWNVRDHHMVDTLDRLMQHVGDEAKAIVWEHNTHVGDARFTDMARSGMVNVGQLVRQGHEHDGVVLVGFSTHHGTVMAGQGWDEPMEVMRVPDAREGSLEHVLNAAGVGDMLLVFDGDQDGGLPGFDQVLGHRAIGVVYDPRHERWGNYVPTIVPRRYDAMLFVNETRAVDAIHMPAIAPSVPETFPSGQ